MSNDISVQRKSKAYTLFRLITVVFAISAPIAMIVAAVIITLSQGDWWFNAFLIDLAAVVMISGTVYLSLLTLMLEITRYVGHKESSVPYDGQIQGLIHRLLFITSIVGLLTFSLLSGVFAVCHFACAGVMAVLYLALWIYKKYNNLSSR